MRGATTPLSHTYSWRDS